MPDSEPQKLLPCIDLSEHRFAAVPYEFEKQSGIEIYCTRCGIDRDRLTPGWEEKTRQDMLRSLEALSRYHQ